MHLEETEQEEKWNTTATRLLFVSSTNKPHLSHGTMKNGHHSIKFIAQGGMFVLDGLLCSKLYGYVVLI
jgi:hypothetical protein